MVLIVRKRQMSENIQFQHPRPNNYLWFPIMEVNVVLRGGKDYLNKDFPGDACYWKIAKRPAGKLSIPTYVSKCKVWVPAVALRTHNYLWFPMCEVNVVMQGGTAT